MARQVLPNVARPALQSPTPHIDVGNCRRFTHAPISTVTSLKNGPSCIMVRIVLPLVQYGPYCLCPILCWRFRHRTGGYDYDLPRAHAAHTLTARGQPQHRSAAALSELYILYSAPSVP
jgi:hypothetical protein